MPRQDLKPTRAELRETKRRLQMVKRGHRLLKRKQESLMVEFFRNMNGYKELEKKASEAATESKRAETRAEMVSGRVGVWSFAMTMSGRVGIKVGRESYMGVRLPSMEVIQDTNVQRLSPGEPPESFAACEAANALVKVLVALSCSESRLRVLLDEIERTKRRVNALELKVIPSLEDDARFIQSQLDEMERQSLFTLKRVRAKVGAGQS